MDNVPFFISIISLALSFVSIQLHAHKHKIDTLPNFLICRDVYMGLHKNSINGFDISTILTDLENILSGCTNNSEMCLHVHLDTISACVMNNLLCEDLKIDETKCKSSEKRFHHKQFITLLRKLDELSFEAKILYRDSKISNFYDAYIDTLKSLKEFYIYRADKTEYTRDMVLKLMTNIKTLKTIKINIEKRPKLRF